MERIFLSILLFMAGLTISVAQVGINTDGDSPNSSAMLDVKSTSKGFLPPRMTFAQRNQIASPAEGLIIFCTNCNQDGTGCICLYMGGQWISLTTSCQLPVTPAEDSHVQSNTQIIWRWSSVPIATGYKWHTSNNFLAASNLGSDTAKTETGLTQGTSYTRYVWAYNDCGHSDPVVMQGQALSCGTSFTRSHSAGSVAPVAKTVTYGTVTGIPGENAKCWITRNLGATQPPNTVDDDTEPSAGWYWQFNRKQGYKHDGNTLTPSWTLTSIDENSDWQSDNDPCSLLLGSAWRIPTYAEWYNVDNSGGWATWSGPWGSHLSMHAAGYLLYSSGSITNRGVFGYYWSSTQYSNTNGYRLGFNSGFCGGGDAYKTYGFPLRCIRE